MQISEAPSTNKTGTGDASQDVQGGPVASVAKQNNPQVGRSENERIDKDMSRKTLRRTVTGLGDSRADRILL